MADLSTVNAAVDDRLASGASAPPCAAGTAVPPCNRLSITIGGPPSFLRTSDDDLEVPTTVQVMWGVLSVAGTALCAYHGYARNQSVGSAIWWGLAGGVFPIIALPVAFAQGFGERAVDLD